jgi:hypothetical protein
LKFRPEDVQESEVPIVIGLLYWVLTSPNKRLQQIYLTVLLSYIGFEIRASRNVIQSHESYDNILKSSTIVQPIQTCTLSHVRPEK